MTTGDNTVGAAVVTGANSGIGRALAVRLVDTGHTVIGVDRALDALPGDVVGVRCDLADPVSVAEAAGTVLAHATTMGGVRGVAAVAGVPGTAPPETVLRVNLFGLRRFVEAMVPGIVPSGAVVLVSSMAGYGGPAEPDAVADMLTWDENKLLDHVRERAWDGALTYRLSKQLVHRYALELCARLHSTGPRCNCVSPGPVHTPILDDFRATMPSVDAVGALLGRHGTAEEIAAAIAFLLSSDASWVNGVDLRLDGGLSALRALGVTGQRRENVNDSSKVEA